jgi:hypothetical protein
MVTLTLGRAGNPRGLFRLDQWNVNKMFAQEPDLKLIRAQHFADY